MEGDDTPYDLGKNDIPADGRSVDVPEDAFETGVLARGSDAVWAFNTNEDHVTVSRGRHAYVEGSGYNEFASTTVSDDGVLELPEELFPNGDYPFSGRFDNGDTCHFVTTNPLLAENVTFVLSNDEYDSLLNE